MQRRHKVRFQSRRMQTSRFEELSDDEETPPPVQGANPSNPQGISSTINRSFDRDWEDMSATAVIPSLFTNWPPVRDPLETESSQLQNETIREILPFLSGTSREFQSYNSHGIPHLLRERHVRFLHKCVGPLPDPYRGADAARPWFFYWSICALCTLGEDVTSFREPLIQTVKWMQNQTGGFAGGQGQMSHLAPTYAVLLALAMVGGDDALDTIDRRAMWQWLGALKQADGGFQMSVGGEEDVRGVYCAATIISLLNLPLELPEASPAKSNGLTSLFSRVPEYISQCQTFEGGISCRPDSEAHGAYAFCALACLSILDDPQVIIQQYLDLPALISWLSARQYAPEGGFAGRTEKLVDGCYSHWVGACWPLVAAALETNEALYSRDALIRYILCACQDTSKRGGLRDKPSKSADAYHTCYVLSGLSSAQHLWTYTKQSASHSARDSAYNWACSGIVPGEQIYDYEDRVEPLHPVFVVPAGVAERTRTYFERIGSF